MIYTILTIADIHFGALEPKRLYNELSQVIEYIKNNKIDLLVIDGDYWDSKQSLNNKISSYGISFMSELHQLSIDFNFQIRVVLGTKSHDYDQLDVFNCFEDNHFKIFRVNTYEETLPDMHAIYCPDETIETKKYVETYIDNITRGGYNIGFFHGNFDVVMVDIPTQETEIQSVNNVIFEYSLWERVVNGPLIAGHWHTHRVYNRLTYVGSYSRFGFGEEEPKGFLITELNTDDNSFTNTFIENKKAQIYKSFIINTQVFSSIDDFSKILNHISEELEADSDMKVRIRIDLMDDSPLTKQFADFTKNFFINSRRVKIAINNKHVSKKKKEEDEKKKEEMNIYNFIDDSNISSELKLQKFILEKYNVSIPIEFIKRYTDKVKM
jgi:DNA repair exonuclease SbcCD nuclease subunit